MVKAFIDNNNVAPRRAGDIAEYFADPSKAFKELGFKTQYDVNQMVIDTWRWQKNNPNGFK